MKNFIKNPMFWAILLASASTFMMGSCGTKEDLTKDVKLYIDGDFIKVPLTVQFQDANEANLPATEAENKNNAFFPDFDIAVTGRDAAKVYTMVLNKNYRLEKGVVEIATKQADLPTGDGKKTLEFTIEATSKTNKYLKIVKSYVLTDSTTTMDVIPVINVKSPPKGIAVATASIAVGANGATTATKISTSSSASIDKVDINVPAGTKFYSKDGKELTGTVAVQLVHFNNRDSAALAAFPGGFQTSKATDLTGKALGSSIFSTYGAMSLEMTVGTTAVKSFSGTGLEVTMDINPNSPSPDQAAKIKAGDQIPVWSIDQNEFDKGWKQEKVATVTAGTGNSLKVTYNQDHLSLWNLATIWATCTSVVTYPGTNFTPGYYYTEVVNVPEGNVAQSFYQNVARTTYTILTLPRNDNFYLKFYKVIGCGRILVYTSQKFGSCGLTPLTLTANANGVASLFSVSGQVSGYCASQPLLLVRPTSTVYYRPSTGSTNNNACWTLLGAVNNGYFNLSAAVTTSGANQSYDFKVIIGGFKTQYFMNKSVDKAPLTLPDGRPVPQLTNGAYYDLQNIILPQEYCTALGL